MPWGKPFDLVPHVNGRGMEIEPPAEYGRSCTLVIHLFVTFNDDAVLEPTTAFMQ